MDTDNTTFSTGEEKIRETRSNAGADALASSVMTGILGLSQKSVDKIMTIVNSTGEAHMMRRSLKLLPLSAHTRLNQILDMVETMPDQDNPELDPEQEDDMVDHFDDRADELPDEEAPLMPGGDDPRLDNEMEDTPLRYDDDDWNPNIDRVQAGYEDSVAEPTADPEEYSRKARRVESAGEKMSFMQYLVRENMDVRADMELANLADEQEKNLDQATQSKIHQARRAGNTKQAAQIRQRAMRQQQNKGMKPKSATERAVAQKKKELANAVKQDRVAKQREQKDNVGI